MAADNELFELALRNSIQFLKLQNLKPEQEQSIKAVALNRRDVLVILPTGYGKSIIYQILPKLYEERSVLRGKKELFCVVVVSPLEYIRRQQVDRLRKLGLRSACLEESPVSDGEIVEGGSNVQVIFGSAEQWLSAKWKNCLKHENIKNVCALVVDEVHTVETW